jgi:hypothetical protein
MFPGPRRGGTQTHQIVQETTIEPNKPIRVNFLRCIEEGHQKPSELEQPHPTRYSKENHINPIDLNLVVSTDRLVVSSDVSGVCSSVVGDAEVVLNNLTQNILYESSSSTTTTNLTSNNLQLDFQQVEKSCPTVKHLSACTVLNYLDPSQCPSPCPSPLRSDKKEVIETYSDYVLSISTKRKEANIRQKEKIYISATRQGKGKVRDRAQGGEKFHDYHENSTTREPHSNPVVIWYPSDRCPEPETTELIPLNMLNNMVLGD